MDADLKLAVLGGHPRHHHGVLGGMRDHRAEIVAGRVGEVFHRAEFAIGKVAAEDLKVSVHALAPHDPCAAFAIHRHGGFVDVAAGFRHGEALVLPFVDLAQVQPELITTRGQSEEGEIFRLLVPALRTLIAVQARGEALIDQEAVAVRTQGQGREVVVSALWRHLAQIEGRVLHRDAAIHQIQHPAVFHVRQFEGHLALRGGDLHAAFRRDGFQLHKDAVFKNGAQLFRHAADLLRIVATGFVGACALRRAAAGLPSVFAGHVVPLLKTVAADLLHLSRCHGDGAVPHGGFLVIETQLDQQFGVHGSRDAAEQDERKKKESFHGWSRRKTQR